MKNHLIAVFMLGASLLQAQLPVDIVYSTFNFNDTLGITRIINRIDCNTNTIIDSFLSPSSCPLNTPPNAVGLCGAIGVCSPLPGGGFTAWKILNQSGYLFLIFDSDMNLVDSTHINSASSALFDTPFPHQDNHEMVIEDGKIYLLWLADWNPNRWEYGIEVQDSATKQTLYSWSSIDLPNCATSQFNIGNPKDVFHPNSVRPFSWNGDDYLIHSCRSSGIYITNINTGVTELMSNEPCSDYEVGFTFSGQHDVQVIDEFSNGFTISFFDNGNALGESSGIIAKVFPQSHTVSLVERISHPLKPFSPFMGSFQVTDWGYVVGWGGSYHPNPDITIFDKAGSILWEKQFVKDTTFSYRAFIIEDNVVIGIDEDRFPDSRPVKWIDPFTGEIFDTKPKLRYLKETTRY